MREITDTVTRDDVEMKRVVLGPGETAMCLDTRGKGPPIITSAGGGEGTVIRTPAHRTVLVGTDAELGQEAARLHARDRPEIDSKVARRYRKLGEVEDADVPDNRQE